MIKRTLIVAAAALTVGSAFALPASAQPASAEPEMPVRGAVMFWLLDRNNDGAIDKTEVEALRTTIFEAVDTDGDGQVTREEFVAVIGQIREFRGRPGRHGYRHYGFEERGERHGPRKGDFAGRRDGPGPQDRRWDRRGDRHGPPRAEFAERRGGRMMRHLGIDSTDGLSKSAFVTATPRLFERADEDGNGSISRSEFGQAAGHIGRLIVME